MYVNTLRLSFVIQGIALFQALYGVKMSTVGIVYTVNITSETTLCATDSTLVTGVVSLVANSVQYLDFLKSFVFNKREVNNC